MSVEKKTIDSANEQRSSMALTTAAIAAVAEKHTELSVSDQRARACALVNRGAVAIDSEGKIMVKANPTAIAHVRQFAPKLLDLDPATDDRTPRQKRDDSFNTTKDRLGTRLATPRLPPPRIQELVDEQVAAEEAKNPLLQGKSDRAKSLKAKLREEITFQVLAQNGRSANALKFNGVS